MLTAKSADLEASCWTPFDSTSLRGEVMAVAQPWKKPGLDGYPHLKKLNDELHSMRFEAGLPSARTIRNHIGRDAQEYWIVNHQAILNAFQQPDLPDLGRLELIVAALAEVARCDDVPSELNRFKSLWKRAVTETVSQASVDPQSDAETDSGSGTEGKPVQDVPEQATESNGEKEQGESGAKGVRADEDQAAEFNYAQESLKGLIINASQALWDDKDALRVFLGVVRRSSGFSRLADAAEERRPANATFYGVKSREFENERSPAGLELVTLHRRLDEHRVKRKWSFTDLENQTGVSAGDWIRWYTHDELPSREAVVAFSHAIHLMLEEHVLLLGLWEAAHDALEVEARCEDLPDQVTFDDAWALRDAAASKLWVLAGVGGDPLSVYGPDLSGGTVPAFTVAGPAGSGRSTALVTIACSLLAAGTRVVLVAPKPSPLRDLASRGGVLACFEQDDLGHDELEELLAQASRAEPVVVVMDDAECLEKCDASRLLEALLQQGAADGTALVLGGDEKELGSGFRWSRRARKAHRGLLLSPREWHAGDLIGVKISGSIAGRPLTPGTGWLHLGDGKLVPVTVPRC
ncbi:ATP-binding protein [Streptomyces sp. BH106]|uniref:ATP-binding protein n=1 Tax=Streptomyces sp. BH106 TaxID=3410409 RepID=UPI003CF29197